MFGIVFFLFHVWHQQAAEQRICNQLGGRCQCIAKVEEMVAKYGLAKWKTLRQSCLKLGKIYVPHRLVRVP